MKAHKFLAAGAVGPISGFVWPVSSPGAWVEAEGPLAACSRGIHVCRPVDLAHWIHDELWEIEVDGEPIEGLDCLIVPRARLVRAIDGWRTDGARRFAEACVARALSLTEGAAGATGATTETRELLDDARFMVDAGYVAVAAYTAALAISRTHADVEEAYRRERAWQSAWIQDEILSVRAL